ncbi:MAG: acetyl-CoA carboxylase biotin carboxyl carrier protein subunit, partial [Acidimicrobiales bacterium]
MADGNDRTVDAPLLGTVVRIALGPGDTFQHGQLLVVLESMKMEHVVTAEWSGSVTGVLVEVGQTVNPGEAMLSTREGAVE